MENLRKKLEISPQQLDEINALLLDPNTQVINDFLNIVNKYGSVKEINRQAAEARSLPNLMARLQESGSPYLQDIEWLIEQRDKGAFISVADYRRKVLGDKADTMTFQDDFAVTLEISALQYFPFLIAEARQVGEAEISPIDDVRASAGYRRHVFGNLLARILEDLVHSFITHKRGQHV